MSGDTFQRGMQRLREMQNRVRASDRLVMRGERQMVMLVKLAPAKLAGFYRRWMAQATDCFHEVEPSLDVQIACGYADYHVDGSTPEELLTKAERALSLLEVIRRHT